MKTNYTLAFALIAILTFSIHKADAQQNISGSFTSGGQNRSYVGAIPNNPAAQLRLVILFCGATETASQMVLRGFNNFIGDSAMVIYPEPSNSTFGFDNSTGVDDFQMVEDLITEIAADYSINKNDICIGGFSNGAVFTYNLVCDFNANNSTRDYRFKAFAIVSGTMEQGTVNTTDCAIAEELPAIIFHGTGDQIMPYAGGNVGFPLNIQTAPTEIITDFWANTINNCSANPAIIPIPNTDTTDGSSVELFQYNCDANKTTALFRINGGLHAWPSGGANIDLAQSRNLDINASFLIAEFFESIYAEPDTTTTDPGTGVGILSKTAKVVSLYPNPTHGQLSIQSDAKLTHVAIYSLSGVLILEENQPQPQMDLGDLQAGVYILRISTASGVITERLIKQ